MSYILLIEDNQINANMVILALQAANFEIRHATRGLDGAKMARADRPSLILMDYDLPDIDGRNLVMLLRKQLGGIDAPPIVAVTGRVNNIEIKMSERIGCAAFVSKPFLPEDLVALTRKLLMPNVDWNTEKSSVDEQQS